MIASATPPAADPTLPAPDAARLNSLLTLLNPSLANLAATLQTSPLELADWLSTPAIAHHLASLTEVSQSLENLRIAAARAPALTACQDLLASDNPVERRRIVSTLLRTPIRPAPAASPRSSTSRRPPPHHVEPTAQAVARPSVHDLAMRIHALTQPATSAATPAPPPAPHTHDPLVTRSHSPPPDSPVLPPAAPMRPGDHTTPRVAASHPSSPACGGGVRRGSASLTEGVCEHGLQTDLVTLPAKPPPPDRLSNRRTSEPRAARLIAAAAASPRPP